MHDLKPPRIKQRSKISAAIQALLLLSAGQESLADDSLMPGSTDCYFEAFDEYKDYECKELIASHGSSDQMSMSKM